MASETAEELRAQRDHARGVACRLAEIAVLNCHTPRDLRAVASVTQLASVFIDHPAPGGVYLRRTDAEQWFAERTRKA